MHSNRRRAIGRNTSAASLLAALAWAPALSALSFDPPFPVNNPLLLASVGLLIGALLAQSIRRSREPAPDGPDLRWWKNP